MKIQLDILRYALYIEEFLNIRKYTYILEQDWAHFISYKITNNPLKELNCLKYFITFYVRNDAGN